MAFVSPSCLREDIKVVRKSCHLGLFHKRLLLVIIFPFLLATSLYAGTTGKIAGKVVDAKTGDPLPGVNIIVMGTTLGAATNLKGEYVILRVPPGTYSVKASMIGYQSFQYDNVRVSVDFTTRLNFTLEPTVLELEKAVTVVAERPLVQMDLTSTSAVVSADVIQQMPVERFQDVVNLQAGVVEGHFRGGRLGEVMYMVDGIPINDVYSGQYAIEVENNAVQELEIISGTFNAEYGQAMSGVVNVVTKEGGANFTGNFSAYVGDYLSTYSDVFWNVGALNPIYNLEMSLSGPLLGKGGKLSFFFSGRYYYDQGYIYGRRIFKPWMHSDFSKDDPRDWVIQTQWGTYTGISNIDSLYKELKDRAEAVPMNPSRRMTGHLKLTARLSPTNKLIYQVLVQRENFRTYTHNFRLNPDGDYKRFRRGFNQSLVWTHVFNSRTYLDFRYAYFLHRYYQYTLADPFDPGYVSPMRLQDAGANAYLTGGMQMWHFYRSTTTHVWRLDLTSQVTNTHQIKTGVEFKRHRLWLHEFEVIPTKPERINPITAYNHNRYIRRPIEFAAYVQDKMELNYMIVNAGLRFDYFRPDGVIPTDFTNPSQSPTQKPETSTQISPRFGVAYPITDRGVIHVSYGHFFQIPNFEFLYTNPEFNIFPLQSTPSPPPQSLLNTIGNAALKPQKTVIYEIGLQQQLTDDIALDLTGYFKDIRNLLGTEVLETIHGIRYARYINRDYGQVRGITVALEKRFSGGFSGSVDYTYQIAKGNASDPNDEFLNKQTDPPIETPKQMVPLDWDRTHALNIRLTAGDPGTYTISLIGRLGTGLPYTPSFQDIRTAVENSERRPPVYTFDLYAYRNFKWNRFNVSLFVKVYNLFDRKNELEVFTDTGRAGYSLASFYSVERPRGLNSFKDYFIRPDFYSAPRRVLLGISVEF